MYDARGGRAGASAGNLGFAAIVVAVVVGAFLFAFAGPDLFGGKRSAATPAGPIGSLADLTDEVDLKRLEAALMAFDPEAHAKLVETISTAGNPSPLQAQQLVANEILPLLADEADVFAAIDVRHIDAMLSRAETGLRRAATGSNRWCKGATYESYESSFNQNPDLAALSLGAAMLADNPGLIQFSVDLTTTLLEAGVEARANPQSRGALTPQDEAAIQGLAFSLIADPQFMSIMMAAQTGANMDEQMRKLDICSLGATMLTATRTLPQDTKGRFWASAFRGNSDFTRLGVGTF